MGSLLRALRYSVVLVLGLFSCGVLAAGDFAVSQVSATSFNGSTTLSWANQSSHFFNNTPGNIEIARSFSLEENSFVVLMNLAANQTSVQLNNLPQGAHFLRVRYSGRTSQTGGGNWDGIITHEVLAEPAETDVQTPSVSVSSSYQITISSQGATRYEYRYRKPSSSWTTRSVSQATVTVSGLTTARYELQARGCNSNGCSPWSAG